MRVQPKTPTGVEIAERVQSILETRNLTLYQVSQKSAAAYGAGSSYVLPHNFYYDLRLKRFSPNLYQVFALSKFSDYRLVDWLHVLGFDLEEIPRLQLLLPSNRTVRLDVSVADPNAWIPWFRNRPDGAASVAPLSQLVEAGPPIRQGSLLEADRWHFLYAKIGLQDVLAFPDLLPGSIVRVNPRPFGRLLCAKRMPANKLFLVEHEEGLCCCRLRPVGKNRILLVSAHLPNAQVELQLNREARVLGVVDIEIRPVIRAQQPEVAKGLANHWQAAPFDRRRRTLSQLLSRARARTALSLREASRLSREIATALDDERYFMSPSSLSDHEARDTPPRHLHKIITLCLLYAVPFHGFLDTVGLPAEQAGQTPIPDRFVPRPAPTGFHDSSQRDEPYGRGFLEDLMHQCEEIPMFLSGALDHICAIASPSLRSFFWIGGIETPLHPYLANALLVSVDRHKKRPVDSRWKPVWEQSLYVVLKRDGTYLCGPCGIENGTLVIHPDSEHSSSRETFRNRRDAEIIGQITAIARRLV